MSITKGQTAPNFKLFNHDKKEIELAQLKGKNVLILFFPFAFTSTCTKELCSVRDDLSYYNNLDCTVIGISTDTIYSLAKYKEEQQLNFTLLSDFNKEASLAFGSIYEMFGFNMKGVSKRSAFVVDKDGIIRYAEVLENAGEIPDFTKIKECLSGLQ